MQVKRLVNGIFGVNTYLIIKDDKAILIDPGMDLDLSYLSNYNITDILITHAHIDHIDGIKHFKNANIYISKEDEVKLYDSSLSLYSMMNMKTPFKENTLNIKTVKDGDLLYLLDINIRVISTPGHTNGSVSYLVNNILFSGDTLFKNSIGRTDFPTGNMIDMKNSLAKFAKLKTEIIVYPGHEEKTTIKDELKDNPYFKRS